jgi:hypothetical protein
MALPSQTPERERWNDWSSGEVALPNERVASDRHAPLREAARERRRRERQVQRERVRRRRAGAVLGLLSAGIFVLGVAAPGGEPALPFVDRSVASSDPKPNTSLEPTRDQIASATAYLRTRRATTSFALIDPRGRLQGANIRRRFSSASVIKAMILAAYLNLVEHRGGSLTEGEHAELSAMIRRSDNGAATRLVRAVGAAGLREVARRVGMRDFKPVVTPWGTSQVTAQDQALLFSRLERAVPRSHHRLARHLLGTIVPEQRWGLPHAAPDGSSVLFKGGWAPAPNGGWRVHQAGSVERGGQRIALAVLSEGNPSQAHGRETIRGVSERVLR